MTEPATKGDVHRLEREIASVRDDLQRLQADRRLNATTAYFGLFVLGIGGILFGLLR